MLIAGAKGFAKELLEVVIQIYPLNEIAFFDDVSENIPPLLFDVYPIIRDFESIEHRFKSNSFFAVGVGRPAARKYFYEKLKMMGGAPTSVFSDSSIIGRHNNVFGECLVVMPNVIIESSNTIGDGTLIHVGAFISHDVTIGKFCEISPFAKILGNVTIGDECAIGTAAVILPGVRIGNKAIVGAGAVVNRDVADGEKVVGVPAKPIA